MKGPDCRLQRCTYWFVGGISTPERSPKSYPASCPWPFQCMFIERTTRIKHVRQRTELNEEHQSQRIWTRPCLHSIVCPSCTIAEKMLLRENIVRNETFPHILWPICVKKHIYLFYQYKVLESRRSKRPHTHRPENMRVFVSSRRVKRWQFFHLFAICFILSFMVFWGPINNYIMSHMKSYSYRYLINSYDFVNDSLSLTQIERLTES